MDAVFVDARCFLGMISFLRFIDPPLVGRQGDSRGLGVIKV